jgi:hypothetical protein
LAVHACTNIFGILASGLRPLSGPSVYRAVRPSDRYCGMS